MREAYTGRVAALLSAAVDRLQGTDAFDRVRTAWDAVYAADSGAQIFLSWEWLRAAVDATGHEPLVLAFRPPAEPAYAAFLPLAIEECRIRGISVRRDVHLLGEPYADYTGLIARPDHASAAVDAFARFLRDELRWEMFFARDVLDERVERIVQQLAAPGYRIAHERSMPCPYIALPADWESYVRTRLGPSSRKTLLRRMRDCESLAGFRAAFNDPATFEQDVDFLLRTRHAHWGGDLAQQRRVFGTLLRSSFEAGILSLLVLWSGEERMAASASFVDRARGVCASYISGWNTDFAQYSPGTAMFGYDIRHAIEGGMTVYDFLRGGESYKALFGAQEERSTNSTAVARRNLHAAFGTRALQGRDALSRLRHRGR